MRKLLYIDRIICALSKCGYKTWGAILSIYILSTTGFAQTTDIDLVSQAQYIQLKAPDGSYKLLSPTADDDGDGIENNLEINGFTYSIQSGLQAWDGDNAKKYFITDPLKWSTDGDPYSDFMEVSGINMPSAISSPENHPLVAARPVISIKMTDYDVIPLATITNTRGGEESSSFTNTVSNSNTVSASVTVGVELNPFKLASAEVTASYSHTWTNTQSSTSSIGSNWSNTRSTQPDQAARLKLRIYMENNGGATALEVEPTVNLSLGDRTIATFIPSQMANILTPPGTSDSRFPKSGTIAVEKDDADNDIIITLDELRAIQMGTPLSLEVVQVSAKVVRWNSNDQDWNSDIDWASFESEIDPVSIDVRAEMGNGTNRRYQVFAGTPYWDPEFTMKDILSLIFQVEKTTEGDFIENRKYPDTWYLSSPTQEIINEWNDAGQPQNMFDLKMPRNSKLVMMSPGQNPEPTVNLASYAADYKHVLVSALPNNFPILSVTASVPVNGETQTFELTQGSNSFYTNTTPLESTPDGPGTVTVKNARGDETISTITLPAIYASAQDVKDYSSFLPDPGGEFWIYPGGDETKPMLLYCLFFDPVTHDSLIQPREYITAGSKTKPRIYSDYMAYGSHYRFHFTKARINPNTLKIFLNDPTFIEEEIIVGQNPASEWILSDVEVGRVVWSYPEIDTGSAHIDLSGTPYYLDVTADFTLHPDALTIIDPSRQKLDVMRGNLSAVSYEYYNYNGIATDSLQLMYGNYQVPSKNGIRSGGNALKVNPTEADGYVSMGSSEALRVTDALTIEAWIYPTGPGFAAPWGGMILNKEGEYELFRANDGTIRWAISNASPAWNWRSSHFSAPENQWLHIALVYDGDRIKTYFNGVLFHDYPGSGAIGDYHNTLNDLWIGGRQNNSKERFQGIIDEVRVWNTARSTSQIEYTFADTLHSAFYSTADSGLIGYWRLDEVEDLGDSGEIVHDLSVNGNNGYLFGDVSLFNIATGIHQVQGQIPDDFTLNQNYPNPFNPVTTISYQLKKESGINIIVYNMMGQIVRTLVSKRQNAGVYNVQWWGLNDHRQSVASGIYLYRMEVDGKSIQSRKMILIR